MSRKPRRRTFDEVVVSAIVRHQRQERIAAARLCACGRPKHHAANSCDVCRRAKVAA